MRARLAVCLLFLVLISGACGGRLVQGGGDDGDGASSNAGSLSDGATSSSGGANSRGGRPGNGGTVASGGRIGSAGTSSTTGGAVPTAGTTSAGGGCVCSAKPCPPGYISVPNTEGCCSHCESACSNALCPAIACGSGSHLELLAGQCCPTCVQDSCEAQRAGYQAFRQQLVEKYSSFGCMTSNDCTVYYEKNQCGVGCGIAMPTAAINNLDGNLQSYAQSSCSPNCMFAVQPCPAPPAPICVRGLCQ
jgi:hypothetical protein